MSQKSITKAKIPLILGITLLTQAFLPLAAQAATYQARLATELPKTMILKPGQVKTIEMRIKNIGSGRWQNSGNNYMSLLSVTLPKRGDPIRRDSQLYTDSWLEKSRVTKIQESIVRPQKEASFVFTIKAPAKEGTYKEDFAVAIRNVGWTLGGRFSLNTKVVNPPKAAAKKGESLVYPIRDATYAAKKFIQSDHEVEMVVGEEKEFSVGFKNVGSKTWNQKGTKAVYMFTSEPSYRQSDFYSPTDISWMSDGQIQMSDETVKPGEIGYFRFTLKAPAAVGEYEETFRLAADDWTWIKDGELRLPVTVKEKKVVAAPDTEDLGPGYPIYKDKKYSAAKLIQSASSLALKPGEVVNFRVGIKNTGEKHWANTGTRFVSLYTGSPNYRTSPLAPIEPSAGWLSRNQIKMETAWANPGEIAFFSFDLTAPQRGGDYVEKFRLASEEWSWIQGGDVEIPITVIAAEAPIDGGQASIAAPKTVEPLLRVGLFPTKEEVRISANGPFEIRLGSNNQLLETLSSGQVATVTFDFVDKLYKLVTPTIAQNTPEYFRFVPLAVSTIMEMTNYEKRPAWNLGINYNRFRGVVETRYSPKKDRFWVINELPMEDYLKGMAETSNGSPMEYLKSMTVAARTYAFYHYLRQTKHKDEFFMVDSFYDQVYRGYSSEMRMPDLATAADATRGIVSTYSGEIAITPYYSRSDGRTRNWSEVWGGQVPWCVSVAVPQDQGQTLWGHGVGMSARGALLMAREGQTVENIMKYFYKGISLERWY